MENETLKEYQIIVQIPGTINMPGTFLKEEYKTTYTDIGNGEKKEETVIITPVYAIETSFEGGWDGNGFIKMCAWFLDRVEVEALCDLGYLEEYKDTILS